MATHDFLFTNTAASSSKYDIKLLPRVTTLCGTVYITYIRYNQIVSCNITWRAWSGGHRGARCRWLRLRTRIVYLSGCSITSLWETLHSDNFECKSVIAVGVWEPRRDESAFVSGRRATIAARTKTKRRIVHGDCRSDENRLRHQWSQAQQAQAQ